MRKPSRTIMSFLSELVKKRLSLNHTSTRVTTAEGKTLVEEVLNGEHLVREVQGGSQSCPGFVVDTKPDLQVAEILPKSVYLGSQDVTQDVELIKEHGITHILSIGVPIPPLAQLSHLSYSFIPALDAPEENIDIFVTKALPMMETILSKGGCIFVHCNAGISRAPTVVMAFLIVHRGFTYQEASSLVAQKRPSAKPNDGFVKQLMALEYKAINDKSNVPVPVTR